MYKHSSEEYKCPICVAIKGEENDSTWIKQSDIFYKDENITGFISSKSIKGNESHPLIVPNDHYENIYDLPENIAHQISNLSKKVALSLKQTRKCEGVTILQNNEPAGDQHAFHYHLHVVPRFENDNFHTEVWEAQKSNPEDRIQYAELLRNYLQQL